MTAEHAEWDAVLGHEMRSPVAAILGYQELLEEGTFGELSPAAREAIHRIRSAADQLLFLIDAVEKRMHDDEPVAAIPARVLIESAIRSVRFDAEGRGTSIDIAHSDVELFTRQTDACRAVALAFGAAIKVSPGLALRVSADHATADHPSAEHPSADGLPADELSADPDRADSGLSPRITIAGSHLDPARDRVAPDLPLTGAGLRLHLAHITAGLVGGSVHLDEAASVHILLPRLTQPD